jgi:hypothetical protein
MLLVSTLPIDGLANVDVYDLVGFHVMNSGIKEEMHKSLELRKKNIFGSLEIVIYFLMIINYRYHILNKININIKIC